MRVKSCPECSSPLDLDEKECGECGFTAGVRSRKWVREQDSLSLEHNFSKFHKKPKYEGICGYCGYEQYSMQRKKCLACGMETNRKIKKYTISNFESSFKRFDKIPRSRIKNILEGIDVDDEFYAANAKFIQKLIIELPRIEENEEKNRLIKFREAEELRIHKEQVILDREARRVEKLREAEEERREAEEKVRIWNLPENVEKRRVESEAEIEKENGLRLEREDNLRNHGFMLTNVELEDHFHSLEVKKAKMNKLITEVLKYRNKDSHYSDRFDWKNHHDNIPLLGELCGDNFRQQFLESVVNNHPKYQFHGDKLVKSYKKMLDRIKRDCHGKDEFYLISDL